MLRKRLHIDFIIMKEYTRNTNTLYDDDVSVSQVSKSVYEF
jgi:hypothetical protein